ncbi:MAG: hypothetical protein QT08_C0022G0018 [archaeon GW2011_AR17]|nr:MAG: hypothetical protein QT08_C0022G0018 [archaeon GW2011_AR17]MBS3154561.1 hypothetical protein [Candidatus Woesearchaeota archaeon]HIH59514.1 hypothetical protein [Nanoarchaeota archaeon]HII14117.1 hypothetical protein [Nanoarchaeota archaeon]HIJ05196.1 hypothetical protein [Nanoarchaeota archaeon]
MWTKIMSLFFIFLLLFTMSACSSEGEIGSEEEASEAIEDVSGDVSELSDSLSEISDDLG